MTAPAQFAFSPCGKLAGIRAHGRIVWLPPDFAKSVRALQDTMDVMQASHDRWREAFRQAREMVEQEADSV